MENKHFNYKVIQRTTLEGVEDLLNMYGVQGWIVLSALGSSLCAFLCGLVLCFLCFNF